MVNKTPDMHFVKKGWGYEKWIVNKPEYCGKLLFFEKGKRCSWHYHELKDEVFYVQSGKLLKLINAHPLALIDQYRSLLRRRLSLLV